MASNDLTQKKFEVLEEQDWTPEKLKKLEEQLWAAADDLRANSGLKSSEYSTPILGLIFLKFADSKYGMYEAEIEAEYKELQGTRKEVPKQEIAIKKCGLYLPEDARYGHLLSLSAKSDISAALKQAMESIEEYNERLQGVLPKDEYSKIGQKVSPGQDKNTLLQRLLKNFASIPQGISCDLFGQIYEYFLAKFALAEGQGGGEFFTPRSVVRLMVEIIEPQQGKIFDPACGSGGMFVQSAKWAARKNKSTQDASENDLFVSGQEKTLETIKLAKMNLVVNGIRGEIKEANSYYEDPFKSLGKFDYVLANPPFNVDEVNLQEIEIDPRLNKYGIPRNKTKTKKASSDGVETIPNANYIWINLFATSLKPTGRAGFVMANSASDARNSEADIRRRLVDDNLVDAMIALPSNMFYTVTLPATLWFFDKAKTDQNILFIDARNIFTQISRSQREFSETQIQRIAVISRLRHGNRQAFTQLIHQYLDHGMQQLSNKIKNYPRMQKQYEQYKAQVDCSQSDHANDQQRALWSQLLAWHSDLPSFPFFSEIFWLQQCFPKAQYEDVVGLCKLASLEEVQEQEYSLNPGRYVGVLMEQDGKTQAEFFQTILSLHHEFEQLNSQAHALEATIAHNIQQITKGKE